MVITTWAGRRKNINSKFDINNMYRSDFISSLIYFQVCTKVRIFIPLNPLVPLNPLKGTLPLNPLKGTLPLNPLKGTLPLNPLKGTLPLNPLKGTLPLNPLKGTYSAARVLLDERGKKHYGKILELHYFYNSFNN
jgi:hypothetical protein